MTFLNNGLANPGYKFFVFSPQKGDHAKNVLRSAVAQLGLFTFRTKFRYPHPQRQGHRRDRQPLAPGGYRCERR